MKIKEKKSLKYLMVPWIPKNNSKSFLTSSHYNTISASKMLTDEGKDTEVQIICNCKPKIIISATKASQFLWKLQKY